MGFEKVLYTDVPIPVPKTGEVLVRLHRIGVCHSDVEVYRQELEIYREGGASLPIIPGHEWAGEVVEVGREARGFRVGDRVTGQCGIGCGRCWLCRQGLHNICPDRVETGVFNRDGAYAEYIAMPYTHTHHLFDLSYQQGAMVEPTTVGLWISRRAGLQPGDRVAVIGSGTVGLMTVHAARLFEPELIACFGRSPFKLQLAKSMGADVVVNLKEQPLPASALEASGGKGFNVVIEATGHPDGVNMALRTALPRGRVVVTGVFEKKMHSVDLNTIMPKELTIIGSLGGPTVFDEVIGLIREGQLNPLPLNTHLLPLSEADEGLATVARGRPDLVKLHLDPSAY